MCLGSGSLKTEAEVQITACGSLRKCPSGKSCEGGVSEKEGMATHSVLLPGESHGQPGVAVHGVTKSWTQLKHLSIAQHT